MTKLSKAQLISIIDEVEIYQNEMDFDKKFQLMKKMNESENFLYFFIANDLVNRLPYTQLPENYFVSFLKTHLQVAYPNASKIELDQLLNISLEVFKALRPLVKALEDSKPLAL